MKHSLFSLDLTSFYGHDIDHQRIAFSVGASVCRSNSLSAVWSGEIFENFESMCDAFFISFNFDGGIFFLLFWALMDYFMVQSGA